MRNSIWSTIIILFVATNCAAQDVNFSQFYELPLLRNPALAGTFKGDLRLTSAFRNQWSSVTVPYRTTALGTELRILTNPNSDNYFSVGLQITNDVAGDSKLSRTQILPMIAFHKSMSAEKDAYLTLGVMGGYSQQRFDPSALKFSDQFVGGAYSPSNATHETFETNNKSYYDVTVGLSYSSEFGNDVKYYLGAALFHITEPMVAFNTSNDVRLNQKYVLNVGVSTPIGEYDRFIVYGDYFREGGSNQAQGGILLKKTLDRQNEEMPVSMSVGAFYRWDDAVVPVVKLEYHSLGFGLTYDVNTSSLKTASHSKGGLELTCSYSTFLNIKNTSLQATRCPSF